MRGLMRTAVAFAAAMLATPIAAPRADDVDTRHAPSVSTAAAENAEADDTWKLVLPYHGVQGVLGREVTSSADEQLGRIVQVLVNQNGQVRAAVIDFGGFLGVGSRRVVVDWGALHFSRAADREHITLDLTRDQIKAAPEYKDGKPIVVLGALTPPPRDM
jgi:hypothetical protein